MLTWGVSRDILHARREQKSRRVVIFDLTRSKTITEVTSAYQAMESIKSGIFFASKYESSSVITATPHLYCFANSLPTRSLLSMDRWKVYRIRHVDNKPLKEMSEEEIQYVLMELEQWRKNPAHKKELRESGDMGFRPSIKFYELFGF